MTTQTGYKKSQWKGEVNQTFRGETGGNAPGIPFGKMPVTPPEALPTAEIQEAAEKQRIAMAPRPVPVNDPGQSEQEQRHFRAFGQALQHERRGFQAKQANVIPKLNHSDFKTLLGDEWIQKRICKEFE